MGRGEGAGVYYKGDTPRVMLKQLETLQPMIDSGVDRETLRDVLPPGGARNALDCALWDLEAKLTGIESWKAAGVGEPAPVLTTFTCGAETPTEMATRAAAYKHARAIKIKLTGEPVDADRVLAVRESRKDVWLMVDANQGFTRTSLDKLMPTLLDNNVKLIEQPFPAGQEELLDDFQCPIPVAADESVQTIEDVPGLLGRFNVVNIKLDKCGGLTEALAMARLARELGLEVMVGPAPFRWTVCSLSFRPFALV